MAGLSNIFLEKFLFPKCNNFIGVYSVDTVPKNLWKKCCCSIINLSEAHQTGSHFIAIYINKQNDLWYFDSYALPPPIHNYHLMNFLEKWIKCEKIKYPLPLYHPIQDFDSIFCGWYAAAFCLFVNLYSDYSLHHFHTLFDTVTLRKNEKIVKHVVKSLCNKIYDVKKDKTKES